MLNLLKKIIILAVFTLFNSLLTEIQLEISISGSIQSVNPGESQKMIYSISVYRSGNNFLTCIGTGEIYLVSD
jgi:hypothetical protein